ncbi:barstar family protein [Bradyrhizobium sp. 170]|uniref:barstar family protein n=1 Tax=Bradyrhizobium sp. 170 TaxID=2782641 RepID=UPI001FFF74B7|nr:barstar family protein [Bradyrhizobium sp. 170]UPK03405.1 barstar family protein [Bradyrhizobium sp. 170]
MKEIALDASAWRDRNDFYDALLPALGAPGWHGRNLDALNDSIGADDISAIRLPFRIKITNAASAPADLQQYLFKFADLLTDLRVHRGCEVYLMLD